MAIELADTAKPMNNGDFPVAEAEDIAYAGGRLADFTPVVATTEAEYQALEASGKRKNGVVYIWFPAGGEDP